MISCQLGNWIYGPRSSEDTVIGKLLTLEFPGFLYICLTRVYNEFKRQASWLQETEILFNYLGESQEFIRRILV